MLQKSRKRAERRWRSHCKFMRRLRSDWNDHGWRRDPVRSWHFGQIDGTSLCNCFFVTSKEAVRFKDTPHCVCSLYECSPRIIGKAGEQYTYQERREFQPAEDWSKRKRNVGLIVRKHRACMRCGRAMIPDMWVVGGRRPRTPLICSACERDRKLA